MEIDASFITGISLGFELVEDNHFYYVAVDLLIVRLLFIKDKS